MMQIVMRLFPYRMGKNSLSKTNIYVYVITNHQNTCIFFSIIIRFFRHTSWSHETGINLRRSVFYTKLSFNIVYFLHKTIFKFKFTNTSNVNGLKQLDSKTLRQPQAFLFQPLPLSLFNRLCCALVSGAPEIRVRAFDVTAVSSASSHHMIRLHCYLLPSDRRRREPF